MTPGKIGRAEGNLESIDDQRVWTNSEVLRHRIMIEKERREWRKRRGIKGEVISWVLLFNAIREQRVKRESEVDCNLIAAGCQPRSIYYGEDEIEYVDHEGLSWDEISGKILNQEEVIAARLEEIWQLQKASSGRVLEIDWQSSSKGKVE